MLNDGSLAVAGDPRASDSAAYYPIDLAILEIDSPPRLDLYHCLRGHFVLYCHGAAVFRASARRQLTANGVTRLYVRLSRGSTDAASEIERILDQPDSAVPALVKAGLLYQSALDVAALTSATPHDRSSIEQATRTAGLIVASLTRDSGCFDALLGLLNHSHSAYAHSVNVCAYAAIVGRSIGMRRTELDELALAAFLHDLGKARVPSQILDKPARLTHLEWSVMRRHPTWSCDMLVRSGLPKSVLRGILQHHERLDGSGYPLGLKGGEIDPLARLVALVDVYDALTSNRVYRPGTRPFDALSIMREDVGTTLDRDLFVSLVRGLARDGGTSVGLTAPRDLLLL